MPHRPRRTPPTLALTVLLLALQGCATAMNTPHDTTPRYPPPGHFHETWNRLKDGPYRFWHHQHLFREIPGGVEMRDIVHYAMPPGAGVARRWLVAPRLAEIFAYRTRVLEQTWGPWTGPA